MNVILTYSCFNVLIRLHSLPLSQHLAIHETFLRWIKSSMDCQLIVSLDNANCPRSFQGISNSPYRRPG